MSPKRCLLAKNIWMDLDSPFKCLGRSAWQSEHTCEILAVTQVCVHGWCWSCLGGVMIVSNFMDEFPFLSIFDTVPKLSSPIGTLYLNMQCFQDCSSLIVCSLGSLSYFIKVQWPIIENDLRRTEQNNHKKKYTFSFSCPPRWPGLSYSIVFM